MTTIRFHFVSTLGQGEVMRRLTDFSAARAEVWPSIDADHLVVHQKGENWAVVTEGTAASWERARYDWDPAGNEVTVTTQDSKLFGPGGGWLIRTTAVDDGTRVDVELTRKPSTFKGRALAALLPVVGPSSLSKSFKVALKAA